LSFFKKLSPKVNSSGSKIFIIYKKNSRKLRKHLKVFDGDKHNFSITFLFYVDVWASHEADLN